MKNQKLIIVLVGTLLLNTIFWQESFGINILILFLFILDANISKLKLLLKSKVGIASISAALISSAMVVIHNSTISILAAIVSLIMLVGIVHFSTIRTAYGVFLSSIIDIIKLPEIFINKSINVSINRKRQLRVLRLILIPIAVFILFVAIFYGANLVFRTAVDDLFFSVSSFFEYIFHRFSFFRILFLIVCFFISSWITYKAVHHYFSILDSNNVEEVQRIKRKPWNLGAIAAGKLPKYGVINTIGLKNENFSSMIMIVSICVLLFVINCIDIITVWFGYADDSAINFSKEVHEGVNYLIISILLSIGIMLYVFRRNQNFYAGNKRLILASKIWILQNAILIISVVIRNYYYIESQGLTHKRVGVFIFLLIVVLGLISLYQKITKARSFYFMSKFNSWSIYFVLIGMSLVNWDMVIVKYNLNHRNTIELDPYYLCSLSDQTILYLWNSEKQIEKWENSSKYSRAIVRPILERRIAKIQHDQRFTQHHSFWSWNLRSHNMKKDLKNIPNFKYDVYMDSEGSRY